MITLSSQDLIAGSIRAGRPRRASAEAEGSRPPSTGEITLAAIPGACKSILQPASLVQLPDIPDKRDPCR
jgi:hypothetical protein